MSEAINFKKYISKKGRFESNNIQLRDEFVGCNFIFVEKNGCLGHCFLDGKKEGETIYCNLHFHQPFQTQSPD